MSLGFGVWHQDNDNSFFLNCRGWFTRAQAVDVGVWPDIHLLVLVCCVWHQENDKDILLLSDRSQEHKEEMLQCSQTFTLSFLYH